MLRGGADTVGSLRTIPILKFQEIPNSAKKKGGVAYGGECAGGGRRKGKKKALGQSFDKGGVKRNCMYKGQNSAA